MKKNNELRHIEFVTNFTCHAEGSLLIRQGNTWVLCTASVEEKVPPFLRNTNQGWVTAEYAMLPRSTSTRIEREIKRGRPNARSTEISRLIGRSLRAAVNLNLLGERTITIDCDVLQADGGTRCASITGGMVALQLAINKLLAQGLLETCPIRHWIAAISVGICNGEPILDLDYAHDSTAEVDLNVVMTDSGDYVELQGTAEGQPFSDQSLTSMKELAHTGIMQLITLQKAACSST